MAHKNESNGGSVTARDKKLPVLQRIGSHNVTKWVITLSTVGVAIFVVLLRLNLFQGPIAEILTVFLALIAALGQLLSFWSTSASEERIKWEREKTVQELLDSWGPKFQELLNYGTGSWREDQFSGVKQHALEAACQQLTDLGLDKPRLCLYARNPTEDDLSDSLKYETHFPIAARLKPSNQEIERDDSKFDELFGCIDSGKVSRIDPRPLREDNRSKVRWNAAIRVPVTLRNRSVALVTLDSTTTGWTNNPTYVSVVEFITYLIGHAYERDAQQEGTESGRNVVQELRKATFDSSDFQGSPDSLGQQREEGETDGN